MIEDPRGGVELGRRHDRSSPPERVHVPRDSRCAGARDGSAGVGEKPEVSTKIVDPDTRHARLGAKPRL